MLRRSMGVPEDSKRVGEESDRTEGVEGGRCVNWRWVASARDAAIVDGSVVGVSLIVVRGGLLDAMEVRSARSASGRWVSVSVMAFYESSI